MSPRATVLQIVLLAAMLASSPVHAILWTEPAPAVAGEPTRVVFLAGAGEAPEVVVEGDRILIVLRCEEMLCFPTPPPAVVEAVLPALDAGTYALATADPGNDGPVVRSELGTLEVVAAVERAPRLLPAEGYWSSPGRAGSGLFLERRGELLAVSSYSYAGSEGMPSWLLATGSHSGDSVPFRMLTFSGGDCLGCPGHSPTELSGLSLIALRLRFESARRAWLDRIGYGGAPATIPLVSLPYGAEYLPVTLTDTVDDEFGPLPLPDLRGRWVFAIEGPDARDEHLVFELSHTTIEGGVVVFSHTATGAPRLTCQSASDERRAGCVHDTGIAFSPPPPEPLGTFYQSGVFFPLGDIEEDRMRGVIEDDGQTWRVRGVRISAPPPVE